MSTHSFYLKPWNINVSFKGCWCSETWNQIAAVFHVESYSKERNKFYSASNTTTSFMHHAPVKLRMEGSFFEFLKVLHLPSVLPLTTINVYLFFKQNSQNPSKIKHIFCTVKHMRKYILACLLGLFWRRNRLCLPKPYLQNQLFKQTA